MSTQQKDLWFLAGIIPPENKTFWILSRKIHPKFYPSLKKSVIPLCTPCFQLDNTIIQGYISLLQPQSEFLSQLHWFYLLCLFFHRIIRIFLIFSYSIPRWFTRKSCSLLCFEKEMKLIWIFVVHGCTPDFRKGFLHSIRRLE